MTREQTKKGDALHQGRAGLGKGGQRTWTRADLGAPSTHLPCLIGLMDDQPTQQIALTGTPGSPWLARSGLEQLDLGALDALAVSIWLQTNAPSARLAKKQKNND